MSCNYLISLPSEWSRSINTIQQGRFVWSTKQRLEVRYGSSVVNLTDSSYYGSLPAEPDIPQNDLFQLCLECLEKIQKTAKHIEKISELTADQANDKSDQWMMLHCKCVTTSSICDIVERRASTYFVPLAMKLLYGKQCVTLQCSMVITMNLLLVMHTLPKKLTNTIGLYLWARPDST